ncbi:glycosyltransferase [Thiosocius teredinicola]|uniref:glycosyltransferase n=1 Tax=Thiosocius teredinicola TaxID=1973002 RepID=UPI000990F6F5
MNPLAGRYEKQGDAGEYRPPKTYSTTDSSPERRVTPIRRVLMVGAPWHHMGQRSGMTPLVAALSARFDLVRTAPSRLDKLTVLLRRALQKLRDKVTGKSRKLSWSPFYDLQKWTVETCAIRKLKSEQFDAVVFESIEDYFQQFAAIRERFPGLRVIGISHQPPGWWRLFAPDSQGRLDAFDEVICLSRHAQTYLTDAVGHPNVHRLPHGVDSEFFCDSATVPPLPGFNVLFCGKWLRDFEALERTVSKALSTHPDWVFHLVVPAGARNIEQHFRLARFDNVQWYSGVSDEDLRDLYIKCQVLYLPLLDATANNAILEAMACGLPILTNGVGGIADYLSDDTAQYIKGDWMEGAVEQLAWCQSNPAALAAQAKAARQKVENELDWRIVAARFADVIGGADPRESVEGTHQ